MLAYTIRRLLIMLPMMLIATFLMFVVVSLSGDPLSQFRAMQPPPSAEVLQAMATHMRLDQPLLLRYWMWLTGLFRGDFGPTINEIDIGATLVQRLAVSLRLIALGVVLGLILAVAVAVIGAVWQFSVADHVTGLVAILMISMPLFWFALLAKRVAVWINSTLGTRLFYTVGDGAGVRTETPWDQIMLLFGVLAIPTFVLALQSFGAWSRYGRVALIEALHSDYVRLARAKGLSEARVIFFHGLRTSLAPMLTVVAASGAAIIGESIVAETVFQWRGMGDLLLNAIRESEVYIVLGWLLVMGLLIMVFNLIADLLYAVLDPRVRYER
jgi:peptide/nickel transport system permease protein